MDSFMEGMPVVRFIASLGNWPLITLLVLNLLFRKFGKDSRNKRLASLFQAISVFAISIFARYIAEKELGDMYFFVGVLGMAVVLFILRQRIFPYTLNCVGCGTKLKLMTIYYKDDNLCESCVAKEPGSNASDEPTEKSD